jgi:hypothetical protein
MVHAVQTSSSLPVNPPPPSNVNPIYNDQWGTSTLTRASVTQKTMIILGFLAIATIVVLLWRKRVSTEPVLQEIQKWVKLNCADLNSDHQEALKKAIMCRKIRVDGGVNPNVKKIIDSSSEDDLCEECKRVEKYVMNYFTVPRDPVPKEQIRSWALSHESNASEDALTRLVQKVRMIEKMLAIALNPKRGVLMMYKESVKQGADPIQTKALAFLLFRYSKLGSRIASLSLATI